VSLSHSSGLSRRQAASIKQAERMSVRALFEGAVST
jgi:hypothetical protein